MYEIQEYDAIYRRKYGWGILIQIVLAVTLIQKLEQAAVIQLLHLDPGSQRDKVSDPDNPDGEECQVFMQWQLFNINLILMYNYLPTFQIVYD